MVLTNEMRTALDAGHGARSARRAALAQMLAPLAPFAAEELWREALGNDDSVHRSSWPAFDPALAADELVTLVVQVDGKVRDKLEVAAGISEARRAGSRRAASAGARPRARRPRDRGRDRPRAQARELRHPLIAAFGKTSGTRACVRCDMPHAHGTQGSIDGTRR